MKSELEAPSSGRSGSKAEGGSGGSSVNANDLHCAKEGLKVVLEGDIDKEAEEEKRELANLLPGAQSPKRARRSGCDRSEKKTSRITSRSCSSPSNRFDRGSEGSLSSPSNSTSRPKSGGESRRESRKQQQRDRSSRKSSRHAQRSRTASLGAVRPSAISAFSSSSLVSPPSNSSSLGELSPSSGEDSPSSGSASSSSTSSSQSTPSSESSSTDSSSSSSDSDDDDSVASDDTNESDDASDNKENGSLNGGLSDTDPEGGRHRGVGRHRGRRWGRGKWRKRILSGENCSNDTDEGLGETVKDGTSNACWTDKIYWFLVVLLAVGVGGVLFTIWLCRRDAAETKSKDNGDRSMAGAGEEGNRIVCGHLGKCPWSGFIK